MKLTQNSIVYSLLLVLLVIAVFTFLWQNDVINSAFYFSFLVAGILTTINFIFGILSIKYSLDKSLNRFLILFLGGMVVRLLLMLGAVFVCLKFLELKWNNFIFSILILYVFYQIIEIYYVIYRNK